MADVVLILPLAACGVRWDRRLPQMYAQITL